MTILKYIGRYCLALGLVAYGAWNLYGEKGPKVTDPHAILTGIGLLLIPDIPDLIASGIKTVSAPILEAWKAKGGS